MSPSPSGWWVFLAVPVLAGAVWACRAPQPAIDVPATWAPVTATPSPTATWTPTAVPTLTPTSTPEPGAVRAQPVGGVYTIRDEDRPSAEGQLTELGVVGAAALAGWPPARWPEVVAVSWCESQWWDGETGDGGYSLGLMQVRWSTWFPWALELGLVGPEQGEMWWDPVVNLRVALGVFLYDLERGYLPWTQWSCRP
jgi:hypothetical protein